jgi:hypothetical protein
MARPKPGKPRRRRGGPARGQGQVRSSQIITTYGPGSLIDLPEDSGLVGGLDLWPSPLNLDGVEEPRLAGRLRTDGGQLPELFTPPAASDDPRKQATGIKVVRFPEWFVVQEGQTASGTGGNRDRSRRLVHRMSLDARRRYEGKRVVATRFVRACPRGHVDDIDWYRFVHGAGDVCRGELWLEERGTSGDLSNLFVRCSCGKRRGMHEAKEIAEAPLGVCNGARPWLGAYAHETCDQPSRLLIRTATNAWFPRIVSVLSLPQRSSDLDDAVAELWDDLSIVEDPAHLAFIKRKPRVARGLASFGDAEVHEAIQRRRAGDADDRPVKQAELDALLSAPEGYGDDVPLDPKFHARRLPDHAWRNEENPNHGRIAAVVQLHRLREVSALAGFTRFEAATPDVNGEYETDVQEAAVGQDTSWFPAVENRGEGIFLQLGGQAVGTWLEHPAVVQRCADLEAGHVRWTAKRSGGQKQQRAFFGGAYVLLHTLSHLLIQSLAMHCGYPAASIRERIYVDQEAHRYGLLLYTASPDAEGTLGGLVQQARRIGYHLSQALRAGALCSNDPVCAQHEPDESTEKRWLHGAACHGCTLVAETSCEMRNDYLDRALVVPVVGAAGNTSFFEAVE